MPLCTYTIYGNNTSMFFRDNKKLCSEKRKIKKNVQNTQTPEKTRWNFIKKTVNSWNKNLWWGMTILRRTARGALCIQWYPNDCCVGGWKWGGGVDATSNGRRRTRSRRAHRRTQSSIKRRAVWSCRYAHTVFWPRCVSACIPVGGDGVWYRVLRTVDEE